jgi:uncharacterized membrane protein YeiH
VRCLPVFRVIGSAIGGCAEANPKRASDAPVECLLVFGVIGCAIGGCAEANLKMLMFGVIGGAIGGCADLTSREPPVLRCNAC